MLEGPRLKSQIWWISCNSAFVQVVELHAKLRALSAVARQQAEELTVWRLTSQPPPAFDLSNNENQDGVSDVGHYQSHQYQTEDVLESHGKVTVARTDELLLSCSSNKLQGHMLNSRWSSYTTKSNETNQKVKLNFLTSLRRFSVSVEQSIISEEQSLHRLEMFPSLLKEDDNKVISYETDFQVFICIFTV